MLPNLLGDKGLITQGSYEDLEERHLSPLPSRERKFVGICVGYYN
jgi:hypothetical protein